MANHLDPNITTDPESAGMSADRLARIDTVLRRYVDAGQIPGIQTVVYRRGQVVQWGCYGQADPATGAPTRPDTLYRIFSMSKPVTCAAVMMLFEEGLVRLMDPLAAYIPAFKDVKVFATPAENGPDRQPLARPIIVHDLLTHTAGLAYGLDDSTPVDVLYRRERMLRPDETLARKVERLAKLPLLYQPGTRYAYSMAIDVLGRLVEIVSGQPFDVFLKERIFEPLGMVDTAFNLPPEKLDRLSLLHIISESGQLYDVLSPPGSEGYAVVQNADLGDMAFGPFMDKTQPFAFFSGGGGLTSTLPDYLRFARMLLNRGELDGVRLLGRKTVEHMTLNQLPPGVLVGPGMGMGYGVGVCENPAHALTLTSVGAYGWGGAAGTECNIDPREDLISILMIQLFPGWQYPVQQEFRTLVNQAIID